MAIVGAIDQGATGAKSLTLAADGAIEVRASARHRQIFPQPRWVGHDPGELLDPL